MGQSVLGGQAQGLAGGGTLFSLNLKLALGFCTCVLRFKE